jgi:hypothetical protein
MNAMVKYHHVMCMRNATIPRDRITVNAMLDIMVMEKFALVSINKRH